MKKMGFMISAVVLFFTMNAFCKEDEKSEKPGINQLKEKEMIARFSVDFIAIKRYRKGLKATVDYLKKQKKLFPKKEGEKIDILKRSQKEDLWRAWQTYYDYLLALDSIKQFYSSFNKIEDDNLKRKAFECGFGAMVAQFRFTLELIELLNKNDDIDIILNESVPELGLPGDTYKDVKYKYLNVAISSDFGAKAAIAKYYKIRGHKFGSDLQEDKNALWEKSKGTNEKMTFLNAIKVTKDKASSAYFPVQAGVSEWMGDVKVWRKGESLITPDQIKKLHKKLEPGDILIERREWYLSNVGLPGFWPHAALYVGTPEERVAYFSDDNNVTAWVKSQGIKTGKFEDLLEDTYPEAYELNLKEQEEGHKPRIIEAMSEGVVFSTLEHSADCDSLALLRPKLSKIEKARAIKNAFHYSGRAYDFDFDFVTDDTIVCTELVYKSYEPRKGFKGITFPLVDIIGHKVTTANEMVKQFDSQHGKPEQQTELIMFLDGKEKEGKAVESDLKEFRKSWKRPKWHFLKD